MIREVILYNFSRPTVAVRQLAEALWEPVAPPSVPLELARPAPEAPMERTKRRLLPAASARYTSGSCPLQSKHDRTVDTYIPSCLTNPLDSGDLYP